jgi:hypothetical protein
LVIPSSRTSTIAIFEGGVEVSRFEEAVERRICESSVEERRGSVATVCIAILRINALWSFTGRGELKRKEVKAGGEEELLLLIV